jgi:hypothetical protein
MLLVYLAILWTLYAVAVLSAHTLDTQPSDGRGELIAVAVLTVGALTAVRPPTRRPAERELVREIRADRRA